MTVLIPNLTAAQLADALGYFSNDAITAMHNGAADVACIASGIQSVVWRLEEIAKECAAAPIVPAPAYGVKALPDHVAQHYGDLGFRIVEFFDKDETAGSFLREDGDGGFVGGLYRMAREIDALRTGATHTALETAPVEEADAKAGAAALSIAGMVDEWYRARVVSDVPCFPAFPADLIQRRLDRFRATPPASTIPSEPEAKGEAGAGPVGEAVAPKSRPLLAENRWHLGAMNDGLFIIDKAPGLTTDAGPWDREDGPELVLNVVALTHDQAKAIVDAHNSAIAAMIAAHPVDEPGEVERSADYRLANDLVLTGMARDAAEAALAETRERLERVEAAARELRGDLRKACANEQIVRWHHVQAIDAMLTTRAALSTQESSAALAGDARDIRSKAQEVLDQASDTYRKLNGQHGSIEGDDGEKCWIVPFDAMEELRAALAGDGKERGR